MTPLWHEREWTNRRIIFLLAIGTLIVSIIWRIPNEFDFLARHIRELVLALALAMGFTYMLRPAVDGFEKLISSTTKYQSRGFATFLVFLCGIALTYVFIIIGLKPIMHDVQGFWESFMVQDPDQRLALVDNWKQSVDQALLPYRDFLPPELTKDAENAIPNFILSVKAALSAHWMSWFSRMGILIELILVPVLVFYFLADGPSLRNELKIVCPPAWRARSARLFDDFDRVLDSYIRGQVLMCLIAWALVTLGLLALGVPHAFTLGLLAGITRAVPIIGPLLGAIPIALVCLLATQSLHITGIVLVGFTLMHFLESKVLLPKVIGHEVDLHPVSVIIALLLGMEFFGFIGVFLAVPVAALVKVLLLEWQENARASTQDNSQNKLELEEHNDTLPSQHS